MKVAGFVLAIIGLILSLIPIVGAFALALLIPAFLLALLGVIISIARKKGGNGLGIAAVILCVIGGFIVSFQIKAGNAVKEAFAGETTQVEIVGFGGYDLGEKLDPKEIQEKDLAAGYITRPAKNKFRNFEEIELYFTPKTFVVYKIRSTEKGNEEDLKVIIASLEEKYKAKMGYSFGGHSFSGKGRTVSADNIYGIDGNINWIAVTDNNLSNQDTKEKEEIVKSKADTSGL